MIWKKDEFGEKNKKDAKRSDNAFTRAVLKAGRGGDRATTVKAEMKWPAGANQPAPADPLLREMKARDELMRAKEARNETTSESEQFRRDEN